MRMVDYPPGWTCERMLLQFELYLLRTLPPGEAWSVAEHLESCPGCAEQLVLYRVTLGRLTRG